MSLLNDQERTECAGDLLVTTNELRLTRLNAVGFACACACMCVCVCVSVALSACSCTSCFPAFLPIACFFRFLLLFAPIIFILPALSSPASPLKPAPDVSACRTGRVVTRTRGSTSISGALAMTAAIFRLSLAGAARAARASSRSRSQRSGRLDLWRMWPVRM